MKRASPAADPRSVLLGCWSLGPGRSPAPATEHLRRGLGFYEDGLTGRGPWPPGQVAVHSAGRRAGAQRRGCQRYGQPSPTGVAVAPYRSPALLPGGDLTDLSSRRFVKSRLGRAWRVLAFRSSLTCSWLADSAHWACAWLTTSLGEAVAKPENGCLGRERGGGSWGGAPGARPGGEPQEGPALGASVIPQGRGGPIPRSISCLPRTGGP